MQDLPLTAQLKALKTHRSGGSPDERWLASTRETLLMQVRNTVTEENKKTGFAAVLGTLRMLAPANLTRTMAMPLAVVLLMFGAGASASALVAAAQGTLPGDALYGVKLAAERVSVRLADRAGRAERRVEIAGRRLDEMARLSASADAEKEDKIARVSGLFSAEMAGIRADLATLEGDDSDEAIRVALAIDAKADAYQDLFKSGAYLGRPSFRMALLSLDQVSVAALEILVRKRQDSPDALPEAQLSSAVGRKIDNFASHVAVTEDRLNAEDAAGSGSLLLAAREAVEEAKVLLSQGDFQAAVRKVREGAELVTEAQSGQDQDKDASATSTDEVPVSASSSDEIVSPR